MNVSQIIANYKDKIKDDCTFFAPDIPRKKLTNAINTYATGVIQSEVLLLFDNTIFGSAKNGIIITDTELLYKQIYEDPSSVKISAIETIDATYEPGKSDIIINGKQIRLLLPNKKVDELFVALLQEISSAGLNSEQNSKPDLDWSEIEQQISAPVPKNCTACGAPNQLNNCEYCETPV